jgi:hypothetical protein
MIVLREFFTKEEYSNMWEELTMICQDDFLIDAKSAGGALDSNGNMLRNNRGLPIESMMDDSIIVKAFNRIDVPLQSTHLINHYMEGHYYGTHQDKSVWTAVTVLHQPVVKYNGGDLVIDNITVKLEPRDVVLFKGETPHSVTPIHYMTPPTSNMDARISVSRFMK